MQLCRPTTFFNRLRIQRLLALFAAACCYGAMLRASLSLGLLVAAATASLGGPARAQPEAPAAATLAQAVRPGPAPVAPASLPAPSAPDPAAETRLPAGVAKTSVDHRLGARGLTGSLGFLCGLQPTPEVRGGAQAFGVDDQGRFLGAKLRLPFR